MQVISRNGNTYVRTAYERGIEKANSELDVDQPLDFIFEQPVHQDSLKLLYTRNYRLLDGISKDTEKEIGRILSNGFANGWNPSKMASELTDRVNAVGKNRSTILARTEVINAHSEAMLNRYEQLGVDTVTIEAELHTAGDDRVCQICKALEGEVVSLDDARNKVFTVDGRDVTLKPPIHPQCRCTLLPVIKDKETEEEEEEDEEEEEQ